MIFFDNTNMQIPYLPFLDSNDLRQAGTIPLHALCSFYHGTQRRNALYPV